MRVLSVAAPVFCNNIDTYRNNNCLFSLIRILVSTAGIFPAGISRIVFAWSGPYPQYDWSKFTNMKNRILKTFKRFFNLTRNGSLKFLCEVKFCLFCWLNCLQKYGESRFSGVAVTSELNSALSAESLSSQKCEKDASLKYNSWKKASYYFLKGCKSAVYLFVGWFNRQRLARVKTIQKENQPYFVIYRIIHRLTYTVFYCYMRTHPYCTHYGVRNGM